MQKPYLPVMVSQVDYVFPAKVIGTLLPPEEELADHPGFNYELSVNKSRADQMFRTGLEVAEWALKPGIDYDLANRHLSAILRSFEPSHEHKMRGVAYLLHSWLL